MGGYMSWFKRYKKGDPLRLVANVAEVNLVHDILENISGIGCRIEKPKALNGLGWRIIFDGSSDHDPIPDSMVGGDTGQIPYKPYDIGGMLANAAPPGIVVWWPYDPAVRAVPIGWEIATEMAGKYPVGFLSGDTDFGSYGAKAWAKTHTHTANLDHTHTIPRDIFQSPIPGTDYENPGDTNYNPCLTYMVPGLKIGEECGITDTERSRSMTWCAGSDTNGDVEIPAAKHLPPSFVGVWIRKL